MARFCHVHIDIFYIDPLSNIEVVVYIRHLAHTLSGEAARIFLVGESVLVVLWDSIQILQGET